MKKFQLILCTCIVTGFLLKTYDKMTAKPETKEELYLRMKAEYEARRAAARPVIAKLDAFSTPRDGAKTVMSAIGTVQELRDALRPCNLDGCDAMALAPRRFA